MDNTILSPAQFQVKRQLERQQRKSARLLNRQQSKFYHEDISTPSMTQQIQQDLKNSSGVSREAILNSQQERSDQIKSLSVDIQTIHHMYNDLENIITTQGDILNNISDNVDHTKE